MFIEEIKKIKCLCCCCKDLRDKVISAYEKEGEEGAIKVIINYDGALCDSSLNMLRLAYKYKEKE